MKQNQNKHDFFVDVKDLLKPKQQHNQTEVKQQ